MGPACAPGPGPGAAGGPASSLWLLASEDQVILLVCSYCCEEGPDSLAGSSPWSMAKPPAMGPGARRALPGASIFGPASAGVPGSVGGLAPAGLGRGEPQLLRRCRGQDAPRQHRPSPASTHRYLAVVPLELQLGAAGCLARSPRGQGSTPSSIFTRM